VLENKLELENEKTLKIEETLKDHIDIIQGLNKKVNNNSEIMDENKKMLLNKIARLEQEMINK
jgi:hypothetical protein